MLVTLRVEEAPSTQSEVFVLNVGQIPLLLTKSAMTTTPVPGYLPSTVPAEVTLLTILTIRLTKTTLGCKLKVTLQLTKLPLVLFIILTLLRTDKQVEQFSSITLRLLTTKICTKSNFF